MNEYSEVEIELSISNPFVNPKIRKILDSCNHIGQLESFINIVDNIKVPEEKNIFKVLISEKTIK